MLYLKSDFQEEPRAPQEQCHLHKWNNLPVGVRPIPAGWVELCGKIRGPRTGTWGVDPECHWESWQFWPIFVSLDEP